MDRTFKRWGCTLAVSLALLAVRPAASHGQEAPQPAKPAEPAKPATPPKPKPQITLADLPADCKVVLDDGQPKSATASTAAAEPAAKPAAKSAPADKSKKAAAAPAKPAASKVKSAAKK